jgi:hypothetical protein
LEVTCFGEKSDYYHGLLDGTYSTNPGAVSPSPDGVNQHFAVFNKGNGTGGVYWLGMEDLKFGSSDLDYQDMVVRVASVPEPTAIVLLLVMLATIGIGMAGRRRPA